MSEVEFAATQRSLDETVQASADGGLAFRIHYWGMTWKHYDNPVHRHSFYEVCYVMGGAGYYEDEGEIFALRSGSHFLSNPGHWHQIRSEDGLQLFFVAFELTGNGQGEEANRIYETALQGNRIPVVEDHENLTALLWRVLYRQAAYGSADRIRATAGLLLSSFAVTFGPEIRSAAKERSASRSSSQLAAMAKRFVRDNLSRNLKLEDVASYLHVSNRHLSRVFREQGGKTFGECLAWERMNVAESRLKTTVYSIKEIAEETGFQSVHYFTRVFTQRFGMPPARYRDECMRRSGMYSAKGEKNG